MEHNAHCLVCGRPEATNDDFLCRDCVNPGSITITCACGSRYELEKDAPATAQLSKELQIVLGPGTAIKTEGCYRCGNAARSKMSVFRIKRTDA